MRVLVTGGSGFIGSHVVRELISSGHEVVIIVRKGDLLLKLQDVRRNINVLYGDLNNILTLLKDNSIDMPESCIHLAWYTESGQYINSNMNLESLSTSINLLVNLFENGCEHFVGAGTCAEYEIKNHTLFENSSLRPDTLYASTKLSLNLIGEQLAKQYNKKFSSGRIFYLYGPHEDRRRLVPSAILSLINNKEFMVSPGNQIRDFLHVADVARAFVTILEQKAQGVFNICSGEAISVKEMLQTIGNIIGKQELFRFGALPYREWEPMYVCGNNDQLKSIGWKPVYNNHTGLENVIGWWKKEILLEKT